MDKLNNEKSYYASLEIVKKLLKQGLLTQEEFVSINDKLIEKYKPVLGQISAHNDLT